MSDTFERYILDVMSGARKGVTPSGLRAVMAGVEPVYRGMVAIRNWRFDCGKGVRRLPRPVISVGNITAGGTGKTPVVRWLCERLDQRGWNAAVLMRGYKAAAGVSDEQRMLEGALAAAQVIVRANPNRWEAGDALLREHPEIDVFALDDGFQHRRLARNLDLVLVSATNPFGFGRVHPRGLLREPLSELRRAGAIMITRSDEVPDAELARIERELRRWNRHAPVYRASHEQVAICVEEQRQPPGWLEGRRVFGFCGIGEPKSFLGRLSQLGTMVGSRAFGDHHAYSEKDLRELDAQAAANGAEVMLTTEKDWVKLAGMSAAGSTRTPLGRVEMAVRFAGDDGERLVEQVLSACSAKSKGSAQSAPSAG